MRTEEELQAGFRIGEWEVLPARRILRRGDEEIAPEPKVFGVLMSLARRDGDVVTFRIEGRTQAETDGTWKLGKNDWTPATKYPRGLTTTVLGSHHVATTQADGTILVHRAQPGGAS